MTSNFSFSVMIYFDFLIFILAFFLTLLDHKKRTSFLEAFFIKYLVCYFVSLIIFCVIIDYKYIMSFFCFWAANAYFNLCFFDEKTDNFSLPTYFFVHWLFVIFLIIMGFYFGNITSL